MGEQTPGTSTADLVFYRMTTGTKPSPNGEYLVALCTEVERLRAVERALHLAIADATDALAAGNNAALSTINTTIQALIDIAVQRISSAHHRARSAEAHTAELEALCRHAASEFATIASGGTDTCIIAPELQGRADAVIGALRDLAGPTLGVPARHARIEAERNRLRGEVVALRGHLAHADLQLATDLGERNRWRCTRCGRESEAPVDGYFDPCPGMAAKAGECAACDGTGSSSPDSAYPESDPCAGCSGTGIRPTTRTPGECRYCGGSGRVAKQGEPVASTDHPIQPLVFDSEGVVRFKANDIVQYLLDLAPTGLNALSLRVHRGEYTAEDYTQLMQLIGYSVSGYGELSSSPDHIVDAANLEAAAMVAAAAAAEASKVSRPGPPCYCKTPSGEYLCEGDGACADAADKAGAS